MQLAYRTAIRCLDAVSLKMKTVAHGNKQLAVVYCDKDDLPTTYDRQDILLSSNKL